MNVLFDNKYLMFFYAAVYAYIWAMNCYCGFILGHTFNAFVAGIMAIPIITALVYGGPVGVKGKEDDQGK